MLFYNARYYDASLGRFVSADAIVPNTSHRALTVDFHETSFVLAVAGENNQNFWFMMGNRERQHATPPWGPGNPQDLNRFSYVNNNPLKYSDPSGHITLVYTGDESYTKLQEAKHRIEEAQREVMRAKESTDKLKDLVGAFMGDLCGAAKGACPTGLVTEAVKALMDLADQDWNAVWEGLQFIWLRLNELEMMWLRYEATTGRQPYGVGLDLYFVNLPIVDTGFIVAQYFITDGNVRYIDRTYFQGDFLDDFQNVLGNADTSKPKK